MQNQENNFTVDTQEGIENANQNSKVVLSNKVIVGGILLICIIGTLLLINGGNDLCLFSTCGYSRFHTTFTSDFGLMQVVQQPY